MALAASAGWGTAAPLAAAASQVSSATAPPAQDPLQNALESSLQSFKTTSLATACSSALSAYFAADRLDGLLKTSLSSIGDALKATPSLAGTVGLVASRIALLVAQSQLFIATLPAAEASLAASVTVSITLRKNAGAALGAAASEFGTILQGLARGEQDGIDHVINGAALLDTAYALVKEILKNDAGLGEVALVAGYLKTAYDAIDDIKQYQRDKGAADTAYVTAVGQYDALLVQLKVAVDTMQSALAACPQKAPESSAGSLGPAPVPCGTGGGCYGTWPKTMDHTYTMQVSVSPHIVQVGQIFTVTIANDEDKPMTWNWNQPPVGKEIGSGCPIDTNTAPKKIGNLDALHCSYRATAATGKWTEIGVEKQDVASSVEEDFYAVEGKGGEHFVSGAVSTPPGNGQGLRLTGVQIGIFSTKPGVFSKKVMTDIGGNYEVAVPETGSYDVVAYPRSSDLKLKPVPSFKPSRQQTVSVTDSSDAVANFELDRGNAISVEIENEAGQPISSAPATGIETGLLAISGSDPNGDPLANTPIQLTINSPSNHGAPLALVCVGDPAAAGTNPTRVWPNLGNDWTSRVSLSLNLDQTGKLQLQVFFGSESGTFAVDAEDVSDPAAFDIAKLDLKAQAAAILTSTRIANDIWQAVSHPAGGGFSLDHTAPFAQLTPPASGGGSSGTATTQIAGWLSTVRASLPGIEFAPVQGSGPNGNIFTAIVFYPSGTMVRDASGDLTFPPSSLALPVTEDGKGLSNLLDFKSTGALSAGYTVVALPRVTAWRSQAQISGPLTINSQPNQPSLYAGAPYAAGPLAPGGTQSRCATG